jgi:hypothetical protein
MRSFNALFVLCFFALTAVTVRSQDIPPGFRNTFYLAPLHLFVNTFQVSYERENSKGNSLLTIANGHFRKDNGSTESGFGMELQYRASLYQNNTEKRRIKGYFGPFLQGAHSTEYNRYYYEPVYYYNMVYTNIRHYTSITTLGGGAVFGLKISLQKFIIDLYAGGGIKYPVINNSERYSNNIFDKNYAGVFPKLGVQFGIAF